MERPQNKLNIELVPEPLWGKSLAKTLKRSEWDRVRRTVYQRQGFKCGICGAEGRLLCHEVWSYDDENHVQTLVGFKAVCNNCNNCIHMGRAHILSREGKINIREVYEHYARVNELQHWTQAKIDYNVARLEFIERSKHGWTTVIGDYNALLEI